MVSRMREMWPGNNDEQSDLLNLVQRNRISMVSHAPRTLNFCDTKSLVYLQMQNEDYNGSSLMDGSSLMMPDEAMMEQLAAANKFPRKMMNNLDVVNLLKQVQSSNALSPRPPSPQQHMLIAPVATTSSAVEPST